MTEARIIELIETYGADPSRWPENEPRPRETFLVPKLQLENES